MELVASQLRLMLEQAYDEIKKLRSFHSAVDELIAVYDRSSILDSSTDTSTKPDNE